MLGIRSINVLCSSSSSNYKIYIEDLFCIPTYILKDGYNICNKLLKTHKSYKNIKVVLGNNTN